MLDWVPGEHSADGLPPSRNEAEGTTVPGSPVHTPQRVYTEIPGGSQGSFQFRTRCFIFVPFSFMPFLSPQQWAGVSQEARREKQASSLGRVTKRPSVERWGCRADGEEHQAGLGQGWAAMWDRVEGRPKARGEPGLGRVLGGQHGHRPGQQAFLDTQNQSYLSSGFRPGSGMARVPRTDRESWRWAFQEPGTLGLCLDKL